MLKNFIYLTILLLLLTQTSKADDEKQSAGNDQPNFVVIFCDDLGWGDLTCFGHPTIATPHLDRMASEGTRLTQFYVAASVCTPSRAALLTGRYPVRTGMWGKRRVLFPEFLIGGLPAAELTIAEMLQTSNYKTGMVGKWHLGHLPQYLPTAHGFDQYYGIPYSNDMEKVEVPNRPGRSIFKDPDWRHFDVPLLSSVAGGETKELERPANQTTITRRYTEKAVEFISESVSEPFFLYLAHSLPHVPLFRHESFADHSRAGLYGDVIEEIDWSVGQVLKQIEASGISDQTMVVFTSDNGPWLTFGDHGGSAGPLRHGKGTTFEGGMRVPTIVWMPSTIPAGVVSAEMGCTLDLLPTLAAMSGTALPDDLVLDGDDLSKTWTAGKPSPRDSLFYYRDNRLMAVRHGRFKAHYVTQDAYTKAGRQATKHEPPVLFDLETDIGEKRDVAKQYPRVLKQIDGKKQQHEAATPIAESQLDRKL